MPKAKTTDKKIIKSELPVLLGEPNNYARAMITEVLRNLGYQRIYSASTAEEIIECAQVWHPHVVILENLLPDLPGTELVRRFRWDSIVPDRGVPCIMLTADPRLETVKKARMAGIDEFAAKPVSHQVVEKRLDEVLYRPRPFIEAKKYIGPCRRRKRTLSYKGNLKRLNDPLQTVQTASSEEDMNKRMLTQCAEQLSSLSGAIDPTNRAQIRQLFHTANEAQEIAKKLEDNALELATACVSRYIQGVGASGELQAAVITAHVDGLHMLLKMADRDDQNRIEIANGLKKIVVQKLREAA